MLAVFVPEIVGVIFSIITGTLLHFFYESTGRNPLAGLIAPVNESVWEHLKLQFFPTLLYSLLEYCTFGKSVPGFLGAKTVGILVGMILILVIFYTYTGIFGRHFLWADILTFIAGVFAAYSVAWSVLKTGLRIDDAAVLVLLLMVLVFAIFTFSPPHIPLFQDPVSQKYGTRSKRKASGN